MTADHDSTRLDELLRQLLDETLTAEAGEELNALLADSGQARARYRSTLRLHAALIRHPQPEKIIRFPPSRQRNWIIAAACILLGGIMITLFTRRPIATLTGSSAAIWSQGDIPGIMPHQPLDLRSGYAEISYRSGVQVILEGPCQFEITSDSTMTVTHGRATAKVPHSVRGFHLDTPAGRITDIGTEFGIAVGSGSEGPVTLAQVFDGEIEIPAGSTPRRLFSGEALAMVRDTGGTRLVSTTGGYQVDLADSARHLPPASGDSRKSGNLALGKPVSSPAHYTMTHGSVFPPQNLTDGRLNDSGTPGDWSFWLAPNGEDGQFTVDLSAPTLIGHVDLQNTRNRTHGDRGMRRFSIQVSNDGEDFEEILRDELARIPELPAPGEDFPFQSFSFPPVTARHVRIVGLDHYRAPERPLENPNHGGGLNEIRVFAP